MPKCEPRGKYAGAKIHLDESECAVLLSDFKAGKINHPLVKEVAQCISVMLTKTPDMLKARTQAQILKALKRDYKKISEQLAAIDGGTDWKEIK